MMKRASDGGEDCRKKSKANDGGEDCAKSAIFDVFVTARFPTSSDDEVATALYRIELLNDADGIASVEHEETADGLVVRVGPFGLRRRAEDAEAGALVVAQLLYAFACLGCERDDEPEVTEDEVDAAVAFLSGIGRGAAAEDDAGARGRRAIVADALAAIDEMVAASAPLDDAAAAVHETAARVLSASECRAVVAAAERHALAAGGWSSARHVAHPTTDLAVGAVAELGWLSPALHARLLPEFERRFALGAARLRVEDLFVAKYACPQGGAATTGGAPQQRGLAPHEDGSAWSFVLPLNDRAEYEGGGTQFVALEGEPTFRPEAGRAVMFSGRNRHCGREITAGVRYILAGFLGVTDDVPDDPPPE